MANRLRPSGAKKPPAPPESVTLVRQGGFYKKNENGNGNGMADFTPEIFIFPCKVKLSFCFYNAGAALDCFLPLWYSFFVIYTVPVVQG